MSISREELHKAIERLPNERLQEALDYLRVLLEEPEELTPEEWEEVRAGQKEIAKGKGISLEEIEDEFGIPR